MMRTRGNLVQLKRYQLKEKSRQLTQLDLMITDFERMAKELDAQIEAEEKKSGVTDQDHFAYPTFARAARQRRDNLIESRNGLSAQREAARIELAEAEMELARAEQLETREGRGPESEVAGRGAMIG